MNPYNKYSSVCPDEIELIAFKSGNLPEKDKKLLTEHLLLCDFCPLALDLLPSEELEYIAVEGNSSSDVQLIPAVLLKAVKNYQKQLSAERKLNPIQLEDFLDKKEELKVGQIWRTKLEGIIFPTAENNNGFSVSQLGSVPHLVVITNPFVEKIWTEDKICQIIKVIPISDNIEYVADGDIVLNKEESSLGYPFMLQSWNQQEMIMKNLDALLGEVDTHHLIDFLSSKGKNQVLDEKSDFSFFGIIKKGIYSNPRMRFRAREFENTAYLRDPVLELREALNQAWEAEDTIFDIEDTEAKEPSYKFFEISRIFSSFATGLADSDKPNDDSANLINIKLFEGELICEFSELPDNEYEIVFRTSESKFADKFFTLLNEDESLKIMVFLSKETSISDDFASVIKVDVRNQIQTVDERLIDTQQFSELFEKGEITEKVINDSISCLATPSGKNSWLKIAQDKQISESIRQIILEKFK